MNFKDSLKDYIRAAFSGIWVQTYEPDEAQREIAQLCDENNNWFHQHWDLAAGNNAGEAKGDPLAALELPTMGLETTTVIMLRHYHCFLKNPMVAEALFNKVVAGKQDRVFFIVLSPVVQIPVELEKLFVVIEHQLPSPFDLANIAAEMLDTDEHHDKLAKDRCHRSSVAAAAGLTRYEAEGSFALSLARHNDLRPEVVWELKQSMLKKSGLLELHRGKEAFAQLGGLDSLKAFCKQALTHANGVKPKGVMLLGVPGTGKSAFAKALGNECGRPTLTMDVGSFYGSLVGQTEERIRQALKIADAMAPCVLFIDEIEKALSGLGSNGDSGVSTRLFGTLLTWLSDHETDVFVVATCNDASKLPPEFSRAERWDGVFFLDLPTSGERCRIWDLYRSQYGLPESLDFQGGHGDADWTGAEIKACCRLAALLDIPLCEAARNVVPVSRTSPEKVSALREWAAGKCLDASQGGIFAVPVPALKVRRSIAKKE